MLNVCQLGINRRKICQIIIVRTNKVAAPELKAEPTNSTSKLASKAIKMMAISKAVAASAEEATNNMLKQDSKVTRMTTRGDQLSLRSGGATLSCPAVYWIKYPLI